jgi:hypothetical protein
MTLGRKIFIHVPKAAGMSIRKSPLLADKIIAATSQIHKSREYSQAVLNKMNSIGDHHGFEHARWRDLNRDIRERFPAFAVIRNPWDRVVSRYFFAKKVIEVEKKEPKGKHAIESFEAFLEERHIWGNQKYMWHRAIRGWYPAFDYVTDDAGKIRCDLLRFENLNEDLCKYFNLQTMSRARNVTGLNPGRYQDMYNPKTIQIVADWYKSDIDAFGYDFDTGPTKKYWNR